MIPEAISRYRNAVITTMAILGIIAVGYFVFQSIQRIGKTQVTIVVAPRDASITVNNEKKSAGDLYLSPGKYTIKASKSGFSDYIKDIEVDTNRKTVPIILSAVSEEARKWAGENQADYLKVEGEAGKVANEQGEVFLNKNPITGVLPYKNYIYKIGYENDPDDPSGNSIIVTIDAMHGYRNAGVKKIRELGYDPAQLKIKFRDYVNPFDE